jgi:hypothetical protein
MPQLNNIGEYVKMAYQYLSWAALFCQVLLCMSLFWRARPNKPRLCMWLLASVLQAILLLATGGVGQDSYFLIYAATEPIRVALLARAVGEAYREEALGYFDIGRVGRWIVQGGIATAAIAATVVFASPAGPWPHAALRALLMLRLAGVGFLAAFALGAALVFGIWTSPSANPLHLRFLTAYLLLDSFGMTAMYRLGQNAVLAVNAVTMACLIILWLAWMWALREKPADPATSLDPLQAEATARALLEGRARSAGHD